MIGIRKSKTIYIAPEEFPIEFVFEVQNIIFSYQLAKKTVKKNARQLTCVFSNFVL